MAKRLTGKAPGRGYLDGQFLIAMPGMKDDRFTRSVIYICAHSDEGAMGLIINQTQQMLFPDLLVQLGIMNEQEAIRLPAHARDQPSRAQRDVQLPAGKGAWPLFRAPLSRRGPLGCAAASSRLFAVLSESA